MSPPLPTTDLRKNVGTWAVPEAQAPAVANTQVQARRDRLLAYRTNVLDFTFNLPLVGFGENQTEALRHRSGGRYLQTLNDYGLQSMG